MLLEVPDDLLFEGVGVGALDDAGAQPDRELVDAAQAGGLADLLGERGGHRCGDGVDAEAVDDVAAADFPEPAESFDLGLDVHGVRRLALGDEAADHVPDQPVCLRVQVVAGDDLGAVVVRLGGVHDDARDVLLGL